MIQTIDCFYLKKVEKAYGEETYLQCIYKNGLDTKIIAVRYGEEIKTIIYETRR